MPTWIYPSEDDDTNSEKSNQHTARTHVDPSSTRKQSKRRRKRPFSALAHAVVGILAPRNAHVTPLAAADNGSSLSIHATLKNGTGALQHAVPVPAPTKATTPFERLERLLSEATAERNRLLATVDRAGEAEQACGVDRIELRAQRNEAIAARDWERAVAGALEQQREETRAENAALELAERELASRELAARELAAAQQHERIGALELVARQANEAAEQLREKLVHAQEQAQAAEARRELNDMQTRAQQATKMAEHAAEQAQQCKLEAERASQEVDHEVRQRVEQAAWKAEVAGQEAEMARGELAEAKEQVGQAVQKARQEVKQEAERARREAEEVRREAEEEIRREAEERGREAEQVRLDGREEAAVAAMLYRSQADAKEKAAAHLTEVDSLRAQVIVGRCQ